MESLYGVQSLTGLFPECFKRRNPVTHRAQEDQSLGHRRGHSRRRRCGSTSTDCKVVLDDLHRLLEKYVVSLGMPATRTWDSAAVGAEKHRDDHNQPIPYAINTFFQKKKAIYKEKE
jgi:hypothetical protein